MSIEIKKNYLSIATKKEICEMIKNNSLTEVNGMKYIDYISKTLSIDMALLQFYCEINLEEINMDELYENETIESVRDMIPDSELNFIEKTVDLMINQEVGVYNSLSGVVNRNLEKLINKIPDEKGMKKVIDSLPKAINKIKPEYLSTITEVFKKDKIQ